MFSSINHLESYHTFILSNYSMPMYNYMYAVVSYREHFHRQIAFCTALSLVGIKLFQFNSIQFKATYHSVILLLLILSHFLKMHYKCHFKLLSISACALVQTGESPSDGG